MGRFETIVVRYRVDVGLRVLEKPKSLFAFYQEIVRVGQTWAQQIEKNNEKSENQIWRSPNQGHEVKLSVLGCLQT